MATYIAAHRLLLELVAFPIGLMFGVVLALLVVQAYRRPQLPAALLAALDGPRHLLDETAVYDGVYEPRHAAPYLGAHEVAHDTAVELGHYIDGDVALVRAYVLLDEPALAGVGA